jgi:hypothetical protein
VKLDHREKGVLKDYLESKVLQDSKDLKVLLDLKDLQAHKVLLAKMELMARMVKMESLRI